MNAAERQSVPLDGCSENLAVRVYERLLRGGGATRKQVAVDEDVDPSDLELAVSALLELRLLRESRDDPEYLMAMSPEIAEVELIGPLERSIHHRYRELAVLRQRLEVMQGAFNEVWWSRQQDQSILVVHSAEEMVLRLDQAAQHCQREMCMMHPGGARDPEQLRQAQPRNLGLLEEGAGIRAIYQHTARADVATREYVSQLTQAGATFRTSTEIFDHLVIFDRREAFASQFDARSGQAGGMVIVRDPAIVALLYRIFEHTWSSASDFEPNQGAYLETLDDLRSTILDLLSAGLKDDVIARRLGISSRTCRRHISAIMDQLNAESRFQAGFAAARTGLLPLPERHSEALSQQHYRHAGPEDAQACA